MNPTLKAVLGTPLSRTVRPLALLEFRGRRTARSLRVVVGWHTVEGSPVVVTPAPWRMNFAASAPVRVHRRGRCLDYVGTLDDDPVAVAETIAALLRSGTSPGALALHVPAGHQFTADDIARTHRAIIRLRPLDS